MKLAVVAGLLVLLVVARVVYDRWRRSLQEAPAHHPVLPAELVGGADRTWVVFTTPLCANCGPVTERLAAAEPDARIVTVDATARPDLAHAFSVRAAPTALLAGPDGTVATRLVGAAAVDHHLATAASSA